MANRLADAISPYLRSHADNPVDWYPWGEEAFAEAARRDVPVLVSIGYSTCHWCHVMARESFSDPMLAARLNARFVAIKVDREEHPDVDASYLAAAGAFTRNLGWPLNVFVTPAGRAFFAGTYFPPRPAPGQASFTQVLEAVSDAWTGRRAEVEDSAAQVAQALVAATASTAPSPLPDRQALDGAVDALLGFEDARFGGFGTAPKFPVVPVLGFLLEHGARRSGEGMNEGDSSLEQSLAARSLAGRTLAAMAASPLRDRIEGGFFRYAVNRDWSEPHYERMLYDNAQLLDAYTCDWQQGVSEDGALAGGAAVNKGSVVESAAVSVAEVVEAAESKAEAATTAAGIADFLLGVLRLPSGGFASAQDSESTVDGERVEGGYYALDAIGRARQRPPALDEKVLTGWNGLAIGALARAGFAFARPDWTDAARRAADRLLERHLRGGRLLRASLGDRASEAMATLEDYGMFAAGLLTLAVTTGEARYATAARGLVDATLQAAAGTASAMPFAVPGGSDGVLVGQGLEIEADPSEGAYPSGLTAIAAAARTLYLLTAQPRYLDAARTALGRVAALAPAQPVGFGAALALMSAFDRGVEQLVVVTPDAPGGSPAPAMDGVPAGVTAGVTDGSTAGVADGGAAAGHAADPLVDAVRLHATALVAVVTESQARAFAEAGFELFADRPSREGLPTAYLCRDFVCRLPVTDPAALSR